MLIFSNEKCSWLSWFSLCSTLGCQCLILAKSKILLIVLYLLFFQEVIDVMDFVIDFFHYWWWFNNIRQCFDKLFIQFNSFLDCFHGIKAGINCNGGNGNGQNFAIFDFARIYYESNLYGYQSRLTITI